MYFLSIFLYYIIFFILKFENVNFGYGRRCLGYFYMVCIVVVYLESILRIMGILGCNSYICGSFEDFRIS